MCALLLLALSVVACSNVVEVKGHAMEPTIKDGERVNYDTYGGAPLQRGDIVVYKNPQSGASFIRRVIGLPGETIRLDSGRVVIDGRPLDEPYVMPGGQTLPQSPNVVYPYAVPAESYFVLGDDRPVSSDSRTSGAISRSRIVGVAKR